MGLAEDRDRGNLIVPHKHDSAQPIHAAKGVMTVNTKDGLWVVPPRRAVWVPVFTAHSIRMIGRVELRTIYLDPKLQPIQGEACCVVRVSKLLHTLQLPISRDPRARRIADAFRERPGDRRPASE